MKQRKVIGKKRIGNVLMLLICCIGVLMGGQKVQATSQVTYDYTVGDEDASYKIKANDTTSDAKGVQCLLDKAIGSEDVVTIYFPAGKYYIDKTLKVYSNTHIILHENAVMYRMDSLINDGLLRNVDQEGQRELVGGYDMSKNITVEGGTWDGGATAKATKSSGIIRFDHAENITFKNCTIKNVYDAHIMELVGVKNVIVTGCTLTGFRASSKNDEAISPSEAIQLDAAWTDNESDLTDEESRWANGSLVDGTACKNVKVDNNTFKNVPSAVGQHHYTLDGKVCNKDITISNNTITCSNDITYCKAAITGCGFDNLTVENNTINGPYSFGARIVASDNVTIQKNKIQKVTSAGIIINNSNQVKITNNTIKNTKNNGIAIDSGIVTDISGNTIDTAKNVGISVDGGTIKTINNNTISDTNNQGISVKMKDDGTVDSITNNTITNAKTDAVVITSGNISNVVSNVIISAGNVGITVGGGNVGSISKNTIKNPKRYGITVRQQSDSAETPIIMTITKNKITNPKQNGINVTAGNITDITSNTVTSAGKNGISITGFSGGKKGATVANLKGNTIKKSKQNGISITAGVIQNISNNKVLSVKKNGISVGGGANITNLATNTITSPKATGITVTGGTIKDIKKNTITGAGKNGMSLSNGSIGTGKKKNRGIIGNTIKNCKYHGIAVSGKTKVSAIASNKITDVKKNGISLSQKAKVRWIIKNNFKKYGKHAIWDGASYKPKMSKNKGV